MQQTKPKIVRQGDVLLVPVEQLPNDAKEIALDRGRIVLAYGEVTGHAHAIADHGVSEAAAAEIAEAAIARAHQARARLYEADGERYLHVVEPVTLTHEEHSPVRLVAGVYHLPTQNEYDAATMRRVAD